MSHALYETRAEAGGIGWNDGSGFSCNWLGGVGAVPPAVHPAQEVLVYAGARCSLVGRSGGRAVRVGGPRNRTERCVLGTFSVQLGMRCRSGKRTRTPQLCGGKTFLSLRSNSRHVVLSSSSPTAARRMRRPPTMRHRRRGRSFQSRSTTHDWDLAKWAAHSGGGRS